MSTAEQSPGETEEMREPVRDSLSLATLSDWLQRAPVFFREEIWEFEAEPRTALSRALWSLRFFVILAEGFVRDRLLLRASGLAYFTSVSVIPGFIAAQAACIARSAD